MIKMPNQKSLPNFSNYNICGRTKSFPWSSKSVLNEDSGISANVDLTKC